MNRLIAERCEGITVLLGRDVPVYAMEAHADREFGSIPPDNDEQCCLIEERWHVFWHPIPDYFTDIAACVRAAEAWRMKDEEYRWYRIDSPGGRGGLFEAVLRDGGNSIPCDDNTPAAALAAALKENAALRSQLAARGEGEPVAKEQKR